MKVYPITPMVCPRPRVRKNGWTYMPAKYQRWKKDFALLNPEMPKPGSTVQFVVPMPKSTPKYKRELLRGTGHTKRPDVDNFLKAFLDAIGSEDSVCWDIRVQKLWGDKGEIRVLK